MTFLALLMNILILVLQYLLGMKEEGRQLTAKEKKKLAEVDEKFQEVFDVAMELGYDPTE